MSNNLQSLLAELATVAPDVCQPKDDGFCLSGYYFSFLGSSGELSAYSQGLEFGQPALDWLTGALMGECKRLKLSCDITYSPDIHCTSARVNDIKIRNDDLTVALLTALIAALKGEAK